MILRAAWVVPISGPPIRDGAVRVAGEHIAAVGPVCKVVGAGEACTDLGDVALTPGLVNPHTHLELTCYRGRMRPAPLWAWFPKLMRLRRAPGQIEREQRGVAEGARESLRAGVTCIGDISRRCLNWQVLRAIPIRKVCFVELLALADDPPRNLDELRAALDEVAEDGLLTAGLSPHAPYTVPPEQIRGAIRLAHERKRPWCTHWAETREERAFLLGEAGALPAYMRDLLAQCNLRSPGLSAIDLLDHCAHGAAPGILAHFNYAQHGDAERLAAAGHTVVYCPRAHRFFGHPPHPYRALLSAGVNVAIGTDSAASNENLALLEELRFLRQSTADPPAAARLLEMVTLRAARALGLGDRVGALQPGHDADLAAFPCCASTDDPAATIIDNAAPPAAVWVAGRRVV